MRTVGEQAVSRTAAGVGAWRPTEGPRRQNRQQHIRVGLRPEESGRRPPGTALAQTNVQEHRRSRRTAPKIRQLGRRAPKMPGS
jgi:hypothetical protein